MTDLLTRLQHIPLNKKELLLRKLSNLGRLSESGNQQSGVMRLSAFLVVEQSSDRPSQQELREYLKSKLPDYMVPSEFKVLDALPLTPNGKIDRTAIQEIETQSDGAEVGDFVPPRTETEKVLAKIWMDLIGFDEISIYDNFFEIGGDSLISIRIIARANEAGLNLTPQLLFEYPTIGELASLLEKKSAAYPSYELVQGEFPLLPIQQWFLEWDHPEPSYWNQAVFLQTPIDFDENALEKALQKLAAHHDALRITVKGADGGQLGSISESGEIPFTRFDLNSLSERLQSEALEQEAAKLHRSLNIHQGPVMRAAYFYLGPDARGRLLLFAHHLAVDWVSWGVILDDLSRLYQGFLQSPEAVVSLPPKTTSIKTWAEKLKDYANSPKLAEEMEFWVSEAHHPEPSLPADYPDGENLVASEQVITAALPADVTWQLLNEANQAYQTRVEELLLTALIKTFFDWTGDPGQRVGLEGHGRENLFSGLDLSRTVGWFTSYYPLWLRLDHPEDTGASIKQVKEKVRVVPHRGVGYGILRYLADRPEVEVLKNSPYPQVLFNYLGRTGNLLPEDLPFVPVYNVSLGNERSSKGERRYLFEINSYIQDERLHLSWIYCQNIYRQETVRDLSADYLANLSRLIAHCMEPDAGGFTPSDFPLADLDDSELDKLSDLLDQID